MRAVREALPIERLHVVPARRAPLREAPTAGPRDRLEMVRLAVAPLGGVVCDDRELRREGCSYTVETLKAMKAEFPRRPLVLVLGADAFHRLPRWRDWEALFTLAHLVVVARACAGSTPPAWLEGRARAVAELDPARAAGDVLFIDVEPLAVSASAIRERLKHGLECASLAPPAVLAYIGNRGLYAG